MKIYTPIVFLILCTIFSCSSSKKISEITLKSHYDTLKTIDKERKKDYYNPMYTTLTEILETRLDLSFNWDSSFVYGKANLILKPHFYPADSVFLNARGFKINEISITDSLGNGRPLNYKYIKDTIRIALGRTFSRKELYNIYIDYVSMPDRLQNKTESRAIKSNKGLYFINPLGKEKNKPRQIWTQGEPESNDSWFPTINGPQAKHKQEIKLTVDAGFITLSNGSLISSKINSDGTRTDTWSQKKAHSTYLTMIAVGDWKVVKDMWNGIEVNYYVEPKYKKYAKMIFGNTPEMLEFFSLKFGQYPWEKYSQIVVRDFVSGAMENTTASVFMEHLQMNKEQHTDNSLEDIIAHELFHHWFGDLVTARSWSNISLNESFATYGEYLWYEHKYGRNEADIKGQMDFIRYLSDTTNYTKKLIRYNFFPDQESMFDDVSYCKGGRVLHILRKYVGDEAFFSACRLYLESNKNSGLADIHNLRHAFEKITGQDLNWFFDQWFLASGHPILDFSVKYDNKGSGSVDIYAVQSQNFDVMPLYRIPLDVDFYIKGKVFRRRINIDKKSQKFSFYFAEGRPDFVNIDAEKMLLGIKYQNKTNEELIFQYKKAPLFLDRLEALQNLAPSLSKDIKIKQLFKDALKDNIWAIRYFAIQCIVENLVDIDMYYDSFVYIAINDKKSLVRAAAVEYVKNLFNKHKNIKSLLAKAKKDPSPMVRKSAGG